MNNPPVAVSDPASPLAEWLATQPIGFRPDVIVDTARDAAIVGLGVSTREAHEMLDLVSEATCSLLQDGFTTIAVLDNQRVGDLYDRFVTGQDVDVDNALAQAWGPWRVAEMRDTLTWLREHNRSRAEAPVRIIGIAGSVVLPTDYDRIIALLTGIDGTAAASVETLLDVIRVAHEGGEHVLRARGMHPGTPFVELARAARATAADLAPCEKREEALGLLDAVVDFHANAIGAGFDGARAERAAADRLIEHHRRTGSRIVLWEGSAHVAAHSAPVIGSHLRNELGDQYVAVHLMFGHGVISRANVPEPWAGSIDAHLAAGSIGRTLDLRTSSTSPVAVCLERPWSTRLISGVYDPADDRRHYVELPSLPGSFDVLVFIPTITPARSLAGDSTDDESG